MTEQQIIDTAIPTPGHAAPPYAVETFPIGTCVTNARGLNVLGWSDCPAKFATLAIAEKICDKWNANA